MKKDKVTMEKIAKTLNISKVSVHKALNDLPGVSGKLKETILNTAENLGYVYKPRTDKPQKIFCYLIPQKYFFFNENFYTKIFYHLDVKCKNHNDKIDLLLLNDDAVINPADFEKYDGIFIAGEIGHENFQKFIGIHKTRPVVCIDYFSYKYPFHYIFIESYLTSYHLVETLIKMGHRKIGFVGNIDYASTVADRYFGYVKALQKNNITPNKNWHINENIEKVSDLNDIPLPDELPSVFFCYCDLAAKKLQHKLSSIGVKIPEDVSLIGFDDTDVCTETVPALSSAGVAKNNIAKEAFSVMFRAFLTDKPITDELFPTIYIRDSVKNLNE